MANSDDLKAIKEIADLLYLDIPGFDWNNEDFIGNQIKRGEYYVAEDGGKVIGIVSLRERKERMYIETLAVAREAQSLGLGRQLVEFAKNFGRENNFKILRTTSFFEYGVKDFYLKNGFRLLSEAGEYGGHKFYRLEVDL